jgi:hypothetical protein
MHNVDNLNREEKNKEKRGARLTPRLRSTVNVLSPLGRGASALTGVGVQIPLLAPLGTKVSLNPKR